MQKARRHNTRLLRPLVGVRFQGLFTPLLAVLFTFPSRYLCTIGLTGVFSLTGWCPRIQTGFLRPRPTQDTRHNKHDSCTGLSPSSVTFSKCVPITCLLIIQVLQPQNDVSFWFGLFRVRSPLLAESLNYFLLLRVLRCFSSPGYLSLRSTMSST
jgi:hypothetical protein